MENLTRFEQDALVEDQDVTRHRHLVESMPLSRLKDQTWWAGSHMSCFIISVWKLIIYRNVSLEIALKLTWQITKFDSDAIFPI